MYKGNHPSGATPNNDVDLREEFGGGCEGKKLHLIDTRRKMRGSKLVKGGCKALSDKHGSVALLGKKSAGKQREGKKTTK